MHDPKTVAHEIKYPWFKYKPWPKKFRHSDDRDFTWKNRMTDAQREKCERHWPLGYRETFITIWHCDPECDGTDDSCGYSFIKLKPEQRAKLKNAAWSEGYEPHFLHCRSKEFSGTAVEAESYYRGLVLLVCRVLDIKYSWADACRYASEAVHIRGGGSGKLGGAFCFLPGWHTNSSEDRKSDREEHFTSILCNIARNILTEKRPWYRHPKWHFWHWEFQCHPLLSLKRWLFSRCCKCGNGFKYGASVCTNSWNGSGPRWFRGEPNVYHDNCDNPHGNNCQANACAINQQN